MADAAGDWDSVEMRVILKQLLAECMLKNANVTQQQQQRDGVNHQQRHGASGKCCASAECFCFARVSIHTPRTSRAFIWVNVTARPCYIADVRCAR